MNKNKQTPVARRRIKAGFLSLLILFFIFATGTYAWFDYRQHKSNELNTAQIEHNITLVENFEPVDNWKKNEKIKKEVYVKNHTPSLEKGLILDDAYIRLSLKEYMEKQKYEYLYHSERLMIDERGEFIKATNRETLVDFIEEQGGDLSQNDIVQLRSYLDDPNHDGYYYLKSKQGSINGQYGKHLIKDRILVETKPLIEGSQRADREEIATNHQQGEHEECFYPVHRWHQDENLEIIDKSPLSKYIELGLGDAVSLDYYERLSQEERNQGLWVLDTNSEAGYAYWNLPLQQEEQTKNLLEFVNLIKQPRDQAYYVLHVDMESVSYDKLSNWPELPHTLAKEWGLLQVEPKIMINYNGDITAGKKFPIDIRIFDNQGEEKELKDDEITVTGNKKAYYEDGYIFTHPLETGPIQVNVKSSELSLSKKVSLNVNMVNYQIPNLEKEDNILSRSQSLFLDTEPESDQYTYTIINHLSEDTRIVDNNRLIIGEDEQADEIKLQVYQNEHLILEEDIGLVQIHAIDLRKDNFPKNHQLKRQESYQFELFISGNQFYQKKPKEDLSYRLSPSINGVSLETESLTKNYLRINQDADLNEKFDIKISSTYDSSVTLSIEDLEVSRQDDIHLEVDSIPKVLEFDLSTNSYQVSARLIDKVTEEDVTKDYQIEYSLESHYEEELKTKVNQEGQIIFNQEAGARAQSSLDVTLKVFVDELKVTKEINFKLLPKAKSIKIIKAPQERVSLKDKERTYQYQAEVLAFNDTIRNDVKIDYTLENNTTKKTNISSNGLLRVSPYEEEGNLEVILKAKGLKTKKHSISVKPEAKSIEISAETNDKTIMSYNDYHDYKVKVRGYYNQTLSDAWSIAYQDKPKLSRVDDEGKIKIREGEKEGRMSFYLYLDDRPEIKSKQQSFTVHPLIKSISVKKPSKIKTYRPNQIYDPQIQAVGSHIDSLEYPQGNFKLIIDNLESQYEISKEEAAYLDREGILHLSDQLQTDDFLSLYITYKDDQQERIYSERLDFKIKEASYHFDPKLPTATEPLEYHKPRVLKVYNENNVEVAIKDIRIDDRITKNTRIYQSDNEYFIEMNSKEDLAEIPIHIKTEDVDKPDFSLNLPAATIKEIKIKNLPRDLKLQRANKIVLEPEVIGHHLSSQHKTLTYSVSNPEIAEIDVDGTLIIKEDAPILDEISVKTTTNYGSKSIESEKYMIDFAKDESIAAIDVQLYDLLTGDYLEPQVLFPGDVASMKIVYYNDDTRKQALKGTENLTQDIEIKTEDKANARILKDEIYINESIDKNLVRLEVLTNGYGYFQTSLDIARIDINVPAARARNSKQSNRFNTDIDITGFAPESLEDDLSQLQVIEVEDLSGSELDTENIFKFYPKKNQGEVHPQIHGNIAVTYQSKLNPRIKKRVIYDAAYQRKDKIQFGHHLHFNNEALKGKKQYFNVMYVAEKNQAEGLKKDDMLIMAEQNITAKEFNQLENRYFKNEFNQKKEIIPAIEGRPEYMGFYFYTYPYSISYYYPKKGYEETEESGIKKVLDSYSTQFLEENPQLKTHVLSYEKENEYIGRDIGSRYKDIVDHVTLPIYEVEENARMFALGVSDVNHYLSQNADGSYFDAKKQRFWLSSPGPYITTAASTSVRGEISDLSVDMLYSGARGAYFISLNDK